jgi:hypothetical protein
MSIDTWNMAMGLSSLISTVILGTLAIALSVYFFVKTKQTEGLVTSALSAIKQQTDSLQKLAAKQMDRLIGVVAEKPEFEQQRAFMVELVKIIQRPAFTESSPKQNEISPEMRSWFLRLNIVAHFYAGLSNVLLGFNLPAKIAEANEWMTKKVDISYSDFFTLDEILQKTDQDFLRNHEIYSWYQECNNVIKPFVRDTISVYKKREQEAQETSE